jgi:hypothetical protein
MTEAQFNFNVTACDAEGYYFPRWDKAIRVSMVATSKQEAINKAAEMLGPTPRRGSNWYWGFRLINITPAPARESSTRIPSQREATR